MEPMLVDGCQDGPDKGPHQGTQRNLWRGRNEAPMVLRITVVGNADIDPALGSMIDSSDIVIRFLYDCRSFGPGGRQTDVVAVCNTGRPGKAMTEGAGLEGQSGGGGSRCHLVRARPGLFCRHARAASF